MCTTRILCSFLLLVVAQEAYAAEGNGSAYLAPWLVGIIAVAVFLVLAFVFLLFNHYVCVKFYEKDEDYEDEEDFRDHRQTSLTKNNSIKPVSENMYENVGFSNSDMVTQL